MSFDFQVLHDGKINQNEYWLGFIIHQRGRNSAGRAVERIDALEFLELNLSVKNRNNGGFVFPLELRNKFHLESQSQVVSRFYLGITDFQVAFKAYPTAHKISLLFASKSGLPLHNLIQPVTIRLFGKGQIIESREIDGNNWNAPAVMWQLAIKHHQKLKLEWSKKGKEIFNFNGDLEYFCRDFAEIKQNNPSINLDVNEYRANPSMVSSNITGVISTTNNISNQNYLGNATAGNNKAKDEGAAIVQMHYTESETARSQIFLSSSAPIEEKEIPSIFDGEEKSKNSAQFTYNSNDSWRQRLFGDSDDPSKSKGEAQPKLHSIKYVFLFFIMTSFFYVILDLYLD